MIEVLFVSAALLGAVLSSYTDLKSGVIPNKLSFSLMGLGLGGYLIYSTYLSNYELLLLVLKNFIIIFVAGYLFWFLGGWSAGDAKELMFLAALVPHYPEFLKQYFAPVLPPYPFALTMLFNTLLAVFPFITLYAIIMSLTKVGIKKFLTPLLDFRAHGFRALLLMAGYSFAMLLGHGLLFLPAILALGLIRDKRASLASAVAMTGAYAFFGAGDPWSILKYFLFAALLLAAIGFFFNAFRILRKEGLRSEMRITDLREGMILAEDFYERDGAVLRDDRDTLEKLWDTIKSRALKKEKLINTGAAGVTEEDIERLRKMLSQGKLENRVMVTRAMPFAPAILLGFLLSLAAGDLVFLLGGFL